MKKIIFILILSISVFVGCTDVKIDSELITQTEEVQPIIECKKISAEEAYNIMNDTDEYILLDVRTDSEFNERHIAGAILIPDYEIFNRAETDLPDKDKLILLYCRSGRRSADATKELCDMGYTNVYDFGGIIDWPYETITGE